MLPVISSEVIHHAQTRSVEINCFVISREKMLLMSNVPAKLHVELLDVTHKLSSGCQVYSEITVAKSYFRASLETEKNFIGFESCLEAVIILVSNLSIL